VTIAKGRPALALSVALVVGAVLWAARGGLVPFAVGLVLAYLLLPAVNRLEDLIRGRWPRGRGGRLGSVVVVYAVAAALAVALAAALVPPLVSQALDLGASLPRIYLRGAALVATANARYEALLVGLTGRPETPAALRPLVDQLTSADALGNLAASALAAARLAARAALAAVTGTAGWLLAWIVVPFWLFYVLLDARRLAAGAMGIVPVRFRADVAAMRHIADRVLSAYVRGQLVVAAVLGTLTTVALFALGVPFALLIGAGAGVLGLVPFVGAIGGAVVGTLVALSVSGALAARALLAFIVIQQVDNLFVTPRVQARSVAMRPAAIMVVLVIGQQVAGAAGLLVAVPLTAVFRDLVHYLYLRAGSDGVSPSGALAGVGYPYSDGDPGPGGAAA